MSHTCADSSLCFGVKFRMGILQKWQILRFISDRRLAENEDASGAPTSP